MRDVSRIDRFTTKLNEVWKEYFPDWRFGQLMSNFLGWACKQDGGDFFFWEEDKFVKMFDKYVKEMFPN